MFFRKYDKVLKDLTDALGPIQDAVVELSKHHSNIFIADTSVKYVVQRLRQLDTSLASDLCKALIIRYRQRRRNEEVSLLEILTKKKYPELSCDFENVSKQGIKRCAVNLASLSRK